MKDLIKQYLDRGISRRQLLSGLGTLGVTTVAAKAMASSLAPFVQEAQNDPPDASSSASPWMRQASGTGGALLVAQLKAAGIEHIFFNPSSGASPFFDALVDEPSLHLIGALQEGALVAMADGYAKATGKTPFVICARPGFPNAMTQMFNTWKDQVPMVIAVDYVSRASQGQEGFEDADHMEIMAEPITKWYWVAQSADKIPEITRRAMKFAYTSPCGPVFLAFPEDTLRDEAKASIMDQAKFANPMKVRPDPERVEATARLLLESKNPLLYVGDELTSCGAQKEAVALAELLGIPVSHDPATIGWSRPFSNRHPLYVGAFLHQMRFPANIDLVLNLGGRLPYGERMPAGAKLAQIRLDPTNLARVAPTDEAMVGDLKLSIRDLLTALHSQATEPRLKQVREERTARVSAYTAEMREYRLAIARGVADHVPVTFERLGLELEAALDKDACVVTDLDSGRKIEYLMSVGGNDKQYFCTTGAALGWGMPASFGVKLGNPDRQVVSVVGDGSFLFSGPQPLWSFARYRAPVTVIVCNNRSYNNERNRIWNTGGRQFQAGRDMTCYLGDPDIDYVKTAAGYGVEGEIVSAPSTLRAALERAKRATEDGRPYLLDVHIERGGLGADSQWHPPFSVAALRQRKV